MVSRLQSKGGGGSVASPDEIKEILSAATRKDKKPKKETQKKVEPKKEIPNEVKKKAAKVDPIEEILQKYPPRPVEIEEKPLTKSVGRGKVRTVQEQDELLAVLENVWKSMPDMRFCQLIDCIYSLVPIRDELFYVEDDSFKSALEEFGRIHYPDRE